MSRDMDEDIIEATIRRVAASKAARLPDVDADEADLAPAADPPKLRVVPSAEDDAAVASANEDTRTPVDESLIEATLRRIEAQQAERAGEIAAPGSVEALRDWQPDPAPEAVDAGVNGRRSGVDEDAIEATLRRIQAQQAERAADEADQPASLESIGSAPGQREQSDQDEAPRLEVEAPFADTVARFRVPADEALIEATLRRIEAEQAAASVDELGSNNHVASTAPEDASSVTQRGVEPLAFPAREDSWRDVTRDLRRDLDETRRQLAALTARIDVMLAGQPGQQLPPSPRVVAPAAPAAHDNDDDWDDSPKMSSMPMGMPPRPAIVRDAAPTAASEPRPIEPAALAPVWTEPAPELTPSVAAPEAKRGFDLLPRTYRITVEDKRRGVDLVPLHRALLGMDGVRDMSLLSYSNGTAIVALETTSELDPDLLGKAVARAMAREVKVEVHNEQTMVIKLAED